MGIDRIEQLKELEKKCSAINIEILELDTEARYFRYIYCLPYKILRAWLRKIA
jgi:hypothetical protein